MVIHELVGFFRGVERDLMGSGFGVGGTTPRLCVYWWMIV